MKIIKTNSFFLFNFFIAFFCIIGCNQIDSEQEITLENNMISMSFNKNTGAFITLKNTDNVFNFLSPSSAQESLWEIDILKDSVVETLEMSAASGFHFSKKDPHTLFLTWDNFSEIENKNFKVKRCYAV